MSVHKRNPLRTEVGTHPIALRSKCTLLDDLPPEMRVLIYNSLLLTDEDADNNKQLHPQILATCKTIHREAQQILDSEKNFTTTMLVRLKVSSTTSPKVRFGIGEQRGIRRAESLYREVLRFERIPSELRRAVIQLTLHVPRRHSIDLQLEDMASARFQLYLLVTQIQTSNIKEVHFKVRILGELSMDEADSSLLYITLPIRQLGKDVTLRVSGAVNEVKQSLQQPFYGHLAFIDRTALSRWLHVHSATEYLDNLLVRASLPDQGAGHLFTSLSAGLGTPVHMNDECRLSQKDYIRYERRLIDEAYDALMKIRSGIWRRLRLQAEATLVSS